MQTIIRNVQWCESVLIVVGYYFSQRGELERGNRFSKGRRAFFKCLKQQQTTIMYLSVYLFTEKQS